MKWRWKQGLTHHDEAKEKKRKKILKREREIGFGFKILERIIGNGKQVEIDSIYMYYLFIFLVG